MPERMIGMYVHQHWAYRHPYAARTWSLEDWRGYLTGLAGLGYNTVMIWPVLETMPDPLAPSDRANLERIAAVIDLAHTAFGMRVLLALCPNVAARNDDAAQYSFEERPFFYCDRRVDPGDASAMRALVTWRERLLAPLAATDGVAIIDSDPGGYPGSTNQEFVALLLRHREMLDRLRPGIELLYWTHAGWEAYCEFYATGVFREGTRKEIEATLSLLADASPEPWGILSSRGADVGGASGGDVGDGVGLADRVVPFRYGAIEGEPSFPLTRFDGTTAYEAGAMPSVRGVMGNAQTHCVQLPNTFAFAHGARGLPLDEAAYHSFANQVIEGHAEEIVGAWQALAGADPATKGTAKQTMEGLLEAALQPGPLGGLLLGDPRRFVNDLLLQLEMTAALQTFHSNVLPTRASDAVVAETFRRFTHAADTWQRQHGYKNAWDWPAMEQALRALDAPPINHALANRDYTGEGDTPFERVQDGFRRVETYTPSLIAAMNDVADGMQGQ